MSETPHAERLEQADLLEAWSRLAHTITFRDYNKLADALLAGAAALRQPKPGTCATCDHYWRTGSECWNKTQGNPLSMRYVPETFGCIYHAPQTETP